MRTKLLIPLFGALASAAWAAPAPWSLGLGSVEDSAVRESKGLKALRSEVEAASHKVEASRAGLFPRLSADANYKYVANVPEVKLNPAAPAIKLGDNHNWSLGLAASWDLLSSRQFKELKVAELLQEARQQELQNQTATLRLRARLSYFQTQLAAERVRLLSNALVLAQNQADDLALRVKAGTSSRIDALAAANEELARRSLLRAARTDLAAALRDLYTLSGLGAGSDPSLPSVDMGDSLPAKIEPPTLIIKLDPLSDSLQALSKAAHTDFDPALSSRLRQLSALRDAARAQAEYAFTGHYPRFNVGARVSEDYPNGFLPETTTQEAVTANVSVPLFSFGAVSSQVAEADSLADASGLRAEAQATDLQRDFLKSKDRLASLAAQRALQQEQVQQTGALADLVFKAYKIGGASYLEVQSASLRALEAGTALAATETQLLIELATLDALSR